MRTWLKFFFILLGLIILVVFHIALAYFLPYPFDRLNILFVVIVLSIVWFESGWIVWISFFLHFLVDLFSPMQFGVALFSSTISVLISFWLYKQIITNRRVIATIFLGVITLILYRLIYLILLFLSSLFTNVSLPGLASLLITFLWELLFTSIFIALFFILSKPFLKKRSL